MPMGRASTRTVGNLVLLSSRAKIKGRRMLGLAVSTLFPQDQYFGCQGFGHMKQECPTYLKTIGKSKALVATLSDIESKGFQQ